eukprot:m.22002 g.22002  ORF g.22002 m.22002 type:complete len:459 (+) comp7313_c0_seq1:40-1416(+)
MAELSALVSRLEAVAARLETASASGGGGDVATAAGGEMLDAFDEIVNGPVKTFIDASASLGDDVAKQADFVKNAFAAQRAFLVTVSQCKKPSDTVLQSLLGDMSKIMGDCTAFKDGNRRSKQFNHISGVAEGLPALGWVAMSPKPAPYVKEMSGSAQFYTNRVIKEFKDSDKSQVEWARSFIEILTQLEKYVKQYHTTGPAWNPSGGEAKAGAAPAAAAPAKAAPAPKVAPAGGIGAAKAGLFSELNKGGAITSGLKKVDKSEMTHKNPELRGTSVVPAAGTKKPAASKPKFGGGDIKKDPVFELQGKKWVVEYHQGNKEIVVESEGAHQTLYIYKCNDCTIQVKGKINAIAVDGCKKTAVVFEDCVAAFEIINCQSVQVQTTGKVATISIDKTDGAILYLSKDCIDASIVSAKSSEMNVSIPDAEGNFTEFPIPEQYKTTFDQANKKLVTEPTDIAG